jgi:hypothetical protein
MWTTLTDDFLVMLVAVASTPAVWPVESVLLLLVFGVVLAPVKVAVVIVAPVLMVQRLLLRACLQVGHLR